MRVTDLITVPLSPLQVRALISWAQDVTTGAVDGLEDGLGTTKLIYHINKREFHLAAAEFNKWCLVKGSINKAAQARRRQEAANFIG